MGSLTLKLVLVAALLVAAACFTLSLPDGTVHCSADPQRPCPTGYVCESGLCWRTSDDFGPGDGGTTD
ncbi:MAG TPA: hypothetical protein VFF06_18560 [Polyangia bacterium]|nr:hypothetical protein [Polyangia bacterium]